MQVYVLHLDEYVCSLYVCMYVCMYVCTYVCMYVYRYTHAFCKSAHVYVYVDVNVTLHVCLRRIIVLASGPHHERHGGILLPNSIECPSLPIHPSASHPDMFTEIADSSSQPASHQPYRQLMSVLNLHVLRPKLTL